MYVYLCVTLLPIIICADSCLTHTHTHILSHGFHAHAQWFNILWPLTMCFSIVHFGALILLTDFNFCDLSCGKPLQAWSCATLVAVYCVSPQLPHHRVIWQSYNVYNNSPGYVKDCCGPVVFKWKCDLNFGERWHKVLMAGWHMLIHLIKCRFAWKEGGGSVLPLAATFHWLFTNNMSWIWYI